MYNGFCPINIQKILNPERHCTSITLWREMYLKLDLWVRGFFFIQNGSCSPFHFSLTQMYLTIPTKFMQTKCSQALFSEYLDNCYLSRFRKRLQRSFGRRINALLGDQLIFYAEDTLRGCLPFKITGFPKFLNVCKCRNNEMYSYCPSFRSRPVL